MKIGLVKNWDGPRRRFVYLFTPGDNDTLEIIELEHERDFTEGLPRSLDLHELPSECVAEINISMGHAGVMALKPNWWGRRKADWWLFRKAVRMGWIKMTRKPV
jgi:hypothetical protein